MRAGVGDCSSLMRPSLMRGFDSLPPCPSCSRSGVILFPEIASRQHPSGKLSWRSGYPLYARDAVQNGDKRVTSLPVCLSSFLLPPSPSLVHSRPPVVGLFQLASNSVQLCQQQPESHLCFVQPKVSRLILPSCWVTQTNGSGVARGLPGHLKAALLVGCASLLIVVDRQKWLAGGLRNATWGLGTWVRGEVDTGGLLGGLFLALSR